MNNSRLSLSKLHDGIRSGDRMVLAKAITIVESTRADDMKLSMALLDTLSAYGGNAVRIGITGVPGVGKSTFIESFGQLIIEEGKKLAVLTIDPSSQLTKGSILGDKTRMEKLSRNPAAFIRPTSSGNVLGGVGGRTREAILLCEAAGFDVVVVETVGVGQSEVAVRNMVDFFLLLMLAGAGDELQGIKKGIMEMADAIVITKADGDNVKHATEAQSEYQHALHLFPPKKSGWIPPVLTSSAYENAGLSAIWTTIQRYFEQTKASGFYDHQRAMQNQQWFEEHFRMALMRDAEGHDALNEARGALRQKIAEGKLSPFKAAEQLLAAYHQQLKDQ